MFEKNTEERKVHRQPLPQNLAQISIIHCTESMHFIDLSMNDKSADTCVSRLHTCVCMLSWEVGSFYLHLYTFMCKCQWLYPAWIWHKNKSVQKILNIAVFRYKSYYYLHVCETFEDYIDIHKREILWRICFEKVIHSHFCIYMYSNIKSYVAKGEKD